MAIPEMLITPLRFVRLCIDIVSEFIYYFLHASHTPLPPISSPLLLDPATVIAKKIKDKKVTTRQVVAVFINRIKEVNPILNCVVDTRFEDAMKEASEVDMLISSSTDEELIRLRVEKPFLGVPFTTKECFAVTGQSWTAGLFARSGVKAKFDAPAVAAMRRAGAIPLGVTNVSELCLWIEASNTVYGRTSNPYHTGRTSGGSSGGEGSVISSGGSPWGIGSDTGGSIRIPSFFNGVFGHKPSAGFVDNSGQLPVIHGDIDKFRTTGPICRHAQDLSPMLSVLAGSRGAELGLGQMVDLGKIKVYYMEDEGGFPLASRVHPELMKAQSEFIKRFSSIHKVKPVKVNLGGTFHTAAIWSHSMASVIKGEDFFQFMKANPWLELFKWCLGQSEHTLPVLCLAIIKNFVSTETEEHKKMINMAEDIRKELQLLLGQDGVLVFPSHANPAPYHTQPIAKAFNLVYTALFNVLGNPVTQIPMGIGSWGLPLGVQVVGGKNMDRLTIAVAREAERLFGGWVPPSPSI